MTVPASPSSRPLDAFAVAVTIGLCLSWGFNIPLLRRDGTLHAGVLAGVLFAVEFLLIYRGLVWTTVTRGTLFLYLAPFLS